MTLPATPLTPMADQPANVDVEQALLGAILVNNGAIDFIAHLQPSDFYDEIHAEIYAVAREMLFAGKPVTPLSLKSRFEKRHISESVSVPQYLGTLAVNATSTRNVRHYAQEIIDHAKRRAIRDLAADLNQAAVIDLEDPQEVIEEFERRCYEIAQGSSNQNDNGCFLEEAVRRAIETTDAARKRATGLSGLATGIKPIDDVMGGLAPTDLIVIAGRPSMGKTAISVNFAYNVARAHRPDMGECNTGGPVGFFSLEMSAEQLATRVISDLSDITASKMRTGRIGPEQFETIQMVGDELRDLPIVIDQTGGLSIGQLAMRARRMKRQHGIRLLIVDYIQLMCSEKRSDNRVAEVSQITAGLKALAKELEIPVIGLSQLSRAVEQRDDKRPQLSDLRESGSIEQDADVVMFIYREEYYLERAKPAEDVTDKKTIDKTVDWQQRMSKVRGKAEAIFAKNRHGPVNTVQLDFKSSTTSFREVGHA